MKQMRKALKKAGLVETQPTGKKRDQFKILHLPSAQYVMKKVKHTSKGNKYTELIVHGKSKAGHIRDLIIDNNGNVNGYSSCPYVLKIIVSPAQLHRACFEFELVVKGVAKD